MHFYLLPLKTGNLDYVFYMVLRYYNCTREEKYLKFESIFEMVLRSTINIKNHI